MDASNGDHTHDDLGDHTHEDPGDHTHDDLGDHTHDDSDGHDHYHGRFGRIRHTISDVFGGHSHDAADSVDSALESSKEGVRALIISFVVLMITAVVQLAIVYWTDSVALLADTIHNFGDALTAVPLFFAFRIGIRPANRQYTYGYRRSQDLAGILIVVLIFASALIVGYESIDRLFNPRPVEHLAVLFAAGLIGFVGNELVALYRIRVGRKIGSAALVADGLHARVDGFTSLAVAAGATGVWLGFPQADPLVGLLVTIAILGVTRSAAITIYHRLMDAVDPGVVDSIEAAVGSVPGVQGVGTVRVRWVGHRMQADLPIRVDPELSVAEGHEVAEDVRLNLIKQVTHLESALIHVDPGTDGHVDSPALQLPMAEHAASSLRDGPRNVDAPTGQSSESKVNSE